MHQNVWILDVLEQLNVNLETENPPYPQIFSMKSHILLMLLMFMGLHRKNWEFFAMVSMEKWKGGMSLILILS